MCYFKVNSQDIRGQGLITKELQLSDVGAQEQPQGPRPGSSLPPQVVFTTSAPFLFQSLSCNTREAEQKDT